MSSARIVAVLEDDPASADALALILSDCGVVAVHGLTAGEVLEKLGGVTHQLEAIIADFNIGDHPHGVDAASELLRAAPHARVLILTGSMRKRGEAVARSVGYQVMYKPARAEAIIDWLLKP